jgi:hypothetical protein
MDHYENLSLCFYDLLEKSKKKFNTYTRGDQLVFKHRQRKSWIISEMKLINPSLTGEIEKFVSNSEEIYLIDYLLEKNSELENKIMEFTKNGSA